METILIICARLIGITLDAVTFAMMIRMLLPLFTDAEGSRVYTFVTLISEPFIIPIRFLLFKMNWLQDSPIDWSFTISYMLIVLIRMFMPVI